MHQKVIVIDDEAHARSGLRAVLENMGCTVDEAACGDNGLEIFNRHGADLVMTDLRMPGSGGISVLEALKKDAPELPVVVITAYGSADTAREALQKGAFDFISKPFDIETIERVVRRALRIADLQSENRALKNMLSEPGDIDKIVGTSEPMKDVFTTIRHVAPTRSNVLIEGESGTGKELIARAIHDISPRKSEPFIPVHCASFSENLLESELFGHEKGAFTGASQRRRGRFEVADAGTLFLDEVSTIPMTVQVALLRVLQERQFERVGGSSPISVDVRIVAATNTSLEKLIQKDRFREDLYYRLNVVSITVPPLRERREDISALIDHFLKKYTRETGKSVHIAPVAREMMESYSWPGNVRELENTIESLVVLCEGHEVTPRDLPAHVIGTSAETNSIDNSSHTMNEMSELDTMTIAELEKWMILRKLKTAQSKAQLAKDLGISRRNLYRRLNEYGVME